MFHSFSVLYSGYHPFFGDGFNIIAISTFLFSITVSLLTLHFTKKTFQSQKKTEEHTRKASFSRQNNVFGDLRRHFYRNIVCTEAFVSLYFQMKRAKYPSETNLMKLQALPTDFFLQLEEESYDWKQLHELKLLIRNYNVEVEVASMHLARKGINIDVLVQDIDNLLFKPLFLSAKILGVEKTLSAPKKSKLYYLEEGSLTIIENHFSNLRCNMGALLKQSALETLAFGWPSWEKLLTNSESKIDIDKDKEPKSSFNRSVNALFRYGKSSNLSQKNASFLAPKTDEKDYLINKASLMDRLTDENREFVKELSAVKDAESLRLLCGVGIEQANQVGTLYKRISSYIAMLANQQIDFRSFLSEIVLIDSAIEVTKSIGMVTFKDE